MLGECGMHCSSSAVGDIRTYAWFVLFGNGPVVPSVINEAGHVGCVRWLRSHIVYAPVLWCLAILVSLPGRLCGEVSQATTGGHRPWLSVQALGLGY